MIFVSGISASGKTHLVNAFASAEGYLHVKASDELVRLGRPIRSITRCEAIKNQELLLEELIRLNLLNVNAILDGHVTIETTEGQIPVPDWFFDSINLTKLIFVTSSPTTILERRIGRGGGDSIVREIAEAQDRELACAKRQAARLSIQCSEVPSHDYMAFRRAVLGV